ncbi:UNVERIFIED_CONTAM: hypothetical protein Sangu_2615200 [Sesamum angustifolium]|uniref:Uncharacterized protein n=1 Tax=Sesamum angustifolium TaxID=2727405 RepID=A0AAW2J654_9LAMI
MVNGYPPNMEEPSFLDLGTAMENAPEPFAPTPASGDFPLDSEENLDWVLGEDAIGMRSPPPATTIDSIVRDLLEEGVWEPKEGGAPSATDEGLLAVTVAIPPLGDKIEGKGGPACGDDKEEMQYDPLP